MSHTYCHTHSKYDCQTCADEILSLGIQADKDRIKWLESEVARLEACAARTVPVEDVVLPIASAYESGIGHYNDSLCNPYKEGSAEAYAYDYGKEFGKSRATEHSVGDAIPHVAVVGEPDCYDAGLLGDFGGGNVEWWQDYIRAELARAHDFYASQWPVATPAAELERLRKDAERGCMLIEHGEWIRRNHDTDEAHALLAIRLPYGADLSCKATREDAIDAAIAQERQP